MSSRPELTPKAQVLPILHIPLAQAEVITRGSQPCEVGQGVDGPSAPRSHANTRPS